MPIDLIPGLPIAFVDVGGGAHSDQLRLSAPDRSCIWEGFPVTLFCGAINCAIPIADPEPAYQISTYTKPAGAGPGSPLESQWPSLYVYDYLHTILCGGALEVRVRATVSGSAQVSVVNPYSGSGFNYPPFNVGAFDTGWNDAGGPDCAQAAAAPFDVVSFGTAWRQFNPLLTAAISDGILEGRWVSAPGTGALYEPFQKYSIVFKPPGDPEVGLTISLPTNSCGVITKTWNQIKADLDAMNLAGTVPIVASINNHGGDTAVPDTGVLAGSICSGWVNDKGGLPI